VLKKLNDKKQVEGKAYDKKLMEIVAKEQQELENIELELEIEKKQQLKAIDEQIKKLKNE
jgi:hypothetical protein